VRDVKKSDLGLSAKSSVTTTRHVTLGGDVVLSASASARPSCPEPLASSAPMATLGPRARYLATGTARAGVMGGARRRGRVYAKPGIRERGVRSARREGKACSARRSAYGT